jgi:hypothetical protein
LASIFVDHDVNCGHAEEFLSSFSTLRAEAYKTHDIFYTVKHISENVDNEEKIGNVIIEFVEKMVLVRFLHIPPSSKPIKEIYWNNFGSK